MKPKRPKPQPRSKLPPKLGYKRNPSPSASSKTTSGSATAVPTSAGVSGDDSNPTSPFSPYHPDSHIEPKYESKMNHLAAAIDEFFNGDVKGSDRKVGFTLLLYPFGEKPGGRINYISNGVDRKDMIAVFKEVIARFEGQPEVPITRA